MNLRSISFLLGLGIAFLSFLLSSMHLKQPFSSYFDFVALFMVIGGSVAVAVIVLPWEHLRDI